jgi:hypothetical protein
VHLVRLIYPARTNASSSLWCIWCCIFGPIEPPQVSPLPSRVSHRPTVWIEPGEWLSTTKLQSKRSDPNARLQLGDLKEAVPSPPNHRHDEFLTGPRQAPIRGQDWGSALTVVPQGAHAYVKLQ